MAPAAEHTEKGGRFAFLGWVGGWGGGVGCCVVGFGSCGDPLLSLGAGCKAAGRVKVRAGPDICLECAAGDPAGAGSTPKPPLGIAASPNSSLTAQRLSSSSFALCAIASPPSSGTLPWPLPLPSFSAPQPHRLLTPHTPRASSSPSSPSTLTATPPAWSPQEEAGRSWTALTGMPCCSQSTTSQQQQQQQQRAPPVALARAAPARSSTRTRAWRQRRSS